MVVVYTKLQRNLSLPLLEERQGKMKRCTFSFLTFHPYLSAVSLDNLKGDVEANAQPGSGFQAADDASVSFPVCFPRFLAPEHPHQNALLDRRVGLSASWKYRADH